jgi:dihydroxy-acid dehydratase
MAVEDGVLAERRRLREEKGWQPEKPRKRKVTTALRAYAALTTSAATGAVRKV